MAAALEKSGVLGDFIVWVFVIMVVCEDDVDVIDVVMLR